MEYLSDELLVEVYLKAELLKADNDFIQVLLQEIKKRNIDIEDFLEVDKE